MKSFLKPTILALALLLAISSNAETSYAPADAEAILSTVQASLKADDVQLSATSGPYKCSTLVNSLGLHNGGLPAYGQTQAEADSKAIARCIKSLCASVSVQASGATCENSTGAMMYAFTLCTDAGRQCEEIGQ